MILKLCFQGEIHRVSNTPPDFQALLEHCIKVFKEKLPSIITLQYDDCDGDRVMLTNDDDYKAMLESDTSSKAMKIYVNHCDGLDVTSHSMIRIRNDEPKEKPEVIEQEETKSDAVSETIEKFDDDLEDIVQSQKEQKEVKMQKGVIDIQKSFRGFAARKAYKSEQEKLKREKQELKKKEEGVIDIQKSFRGFAARKAYKSEQEKLKRDKEEALKKMEEEEKARLEQEMLEKKKVEEEQAHQDKLLNASIKIQSSYKGFKTRQGLKKFFENVLSEGVHNNPQNQHDAANILEKSIEEILKQKDEILHPEEPIIEQLNIQQKNEDKGQQANVLEHSNLKETMKEVLFESFPELIKLLKQEVLPPKEVVPIKEIQEERKVVESPPQVYQSNEDIELRKIVKRLIDHYKVLPDFHKESINEALGGSMESLVKLQQIPSFKLDQSFWASSSKNEPTRNLDASQSLQSSQMIKTYGCQFLKEISSIPKRVTLRDLIVYKTVSLRNTGNVEWPKNCFLKHIEGAKGQDTKLTNLGPGKDFSSVIGVYNPGKPGYYKSIWQFAFTDEKGNVQYAGNPFEVYFEVEDSSDQSLNKSVKIDPKGKIYSDHIVKKAQEMKSILSDADINNLSEFISRSPNMSLDELIESYLSKHH